MLDGMEIVSKVVGYLRFMNPEEEWQDAWDSFQGKAIIEPMFTHVIWNGQEFLNDGPVAKAASKLMAMRYCSRGYGTEDFGHWHPDRPSLQPHFVAITDENSLKPAHYHQME